MTTPEQIQDLAREIISGYLFRPEAVAVELADSGGRGLTLQIRVADSDYGKAVGKKGKNVVALGNLLRIIGAASGLVVRISLEMPRNQNPLFCAPDAPALPSWNPRALVELFSRVVASVAGSCLVEVERADGQTKLVGTTKLPDEQLRPMLEEALNTLFHAMGRLQGQQVVVELVEPTATASPIL